MKQFNKKGFTIVELIIVIAIVAVLASILIPTFANVINKANDSAYQQERTNQMIKDVTEKVENSKWLSQEDFEKALAEALEERNTGSYAEVIEKIIADYYKNNKSDGDSTGISAEQVQKIIEQALAGKLTNNQVKVIIEKAVGDTLSEKDVKDIIEKALKDLPQTGITADELKAAVAKAVEGLANADEIKQLIDNAINNLPALTEDEIKAIIENAINNAESKKYVYVAGANPAEFDDNDNIYVYRTFAKLNTVELTAAAGKNIHLIIDAPNVSTINVNGEYSEIEVQSTAPTSTHIKGSAEKVTLNSGRVVVEDGATVTEFTAAPATNSTTVVVNEGTIDTLYLEYQEHGYAAGNRDYIEVVNTNTVNAMITASPDLESGEQSTTNVVLEGVGTDKVSSDSNLPVPVEYTSGSKEYVADKSGSVAVESIEGVARIGKQGYSTLQAAIDAAKAGEKVVLLQDISVSNYIGVGKSIIIDGDGYTMTSTANRGIRVTASNVDVTVKNVTITGTNLERALQVDSDMVNVKFTIDNVDAFSTLYTFNFCANTVVDVVIKNSKLVGWSALNIWSNGVSIVADNSTFIGINDKGVGSSNGFAVVVLEGDSTGKTPMHSSDMTVDFNNCVLNAETKSSNMQAIIGFNNSGSTGSINNIVKINNSTLSFSGENGKLYYDYGTENQLLINGSNLNGESINGYATAPQYKTEAIAYPGDAFNAKCAELEEAGYTITKVVYADSTYQSVKIYYTK